MDTSLRQATDTFETVNGQLGSCLCSEKYLKSNGAPHDSRLQIFRFCSVAPIHRVYTFIHLDHKAGCEHLPAGLKITDSRLPVMMTRQIFFSPDKPRFWPVK